MALNVSRNWKRLASYSNTVCKFSLASTSKAEDVIVVTDNGSVVCWHPEKQIPYEHTRPLPELPAESNSVLKVQNKNEVMNIFKQKSGSFVVEELAKMTYTTKHRWYPRARDKYAKKTPPDRDFL